MAFLGMGEKHLDIVVELAIVPLALVMVNVAQKANEVLVEPVLLLIPIVNGLVMVVPGVQVSHLL